MWGGAKVPLFSFFADIYFKHFFHTKASEENLRWQKSSKWDYYMEKLNQMKWNETEYFSLFKSTNFLFNVSGIL